MQKIIEVKVLKREDQPGRFENIELRIGNHNSTGMGLQHFSANPLVGSMGPGNKDLEHVFKMARPVNGRFLTLQMLEKSYLEVDEIFVRVAL